MLSFTIPGVFNKHILSSKTACRKQVVLERLVPGATASAAPSWATLMVERSERVRRGHVGYGSCTGEHIFNSGTWSTAGLTVLCIHV